MSVESSLVMDLVALINDELVKLSIVMELAVALIKVVVGFIAIERPRITV